MMAVGLAMQRPWIDRVCLTWFDLCSSLVSTCADSVRQWEAVRRPSSELTRHPAPRPTYQCHHTDLHLSNVPVKLHTNRHCQTPSPPTSLAESPRCFHGLRLDSRCNVRCRHCQIRTGKCHVTMSPTRGRGCLLTPGALWLVLDDPLSRPAMIRTSHLILYSLYPPITCMYHC